MRARSSRVLGATCGGIVSRPFPVPLLFVLTVAERVVRNEVEQQVVEAEIGRSLGRQHFDESVVGFVDLLPPHREAIELGHDAAIEIAIREQEIFEAGRTLEWTDAVELTGSIDRTIR